MLTVPPTDPDTETLPSLPVKLGYDTEPLGVQFAAPAPVEISTEPVGVPLTEIVAEVPENAG